MKRMEVIPLALSGSGAVVMTDAGAKYPYLASHRPPRYWVAPGLLLGGSIKGLKDYRRLVRGFDIGLVVNCDPGADNGIVPWGRLFEVSSLRLLTAADGAWPYHQVRPLVEAVAGALADGDAVYLHCEGGIGSSPTMAYALLRLLYRLSPYESLARINAGVRLVCRTLVGPYSTERSVPPFDMDAFGWVESLIPQTVDSQPVEV